MLRQSLIERSFSLDGKGWANELSSLLAVENFRVDG